MLLFGPSQVLLASEGKDSPLTRKYLDLVSGLKATLAEDSTAKATVVLFLSARCPCSNSHVGLVKQMSQEFPEYRFVGIHANANEPEEEARKYFKEKGLKFPVLEDVNGALAEHFKAFKTPHVFVVDKNQQILYKGGVTNSSVASDSDRNYLREALNDLKAGSTVRTPEGRTLGCTISRGKNENPF